MNLKKLIFLVAIIAMGAVATSVYRNDFVHSPDDGHAPGHAGHAGQAGHGSGKSSQITVWDERFEIFLEHQFIVANKATEFVTHVTNRKTFSPRKKGSVIFVLTDESKKSIKFIDNTPARDGIYIPGLTFPHAGKWNVSLIIPTGATEHRVDLPAIMVYGSQAQADLAPADKELSGSSFLKEQQWEIPFATVAVKRRNIQGQTVLTVPESALIDEDGTSVAFVQLGGEVFEERELKLGKTEHDSVEILSGLSEGEYIVTEGAHAIIEAEHELHAESIVQLSDEDVKRFGIEVGTVGSGAFEVHVSVPGEITFNESTLAHIVPGISGIVREVGGDIGDTVTVGDAIAWLESTELGGAKVQYLTRQSEVSCCSIELARAQDIHNNTLKLLEMLKTSPSLEALRSFGGSAMGMNRSLLVSSYAEFIFARDTYLREKDLYEKKITSKQDFLKAESAFKKADAQYVATQDSVNFDVSRNLLEAKRARDVQEIELKAAERLLYVLGLTAEDVNNLNVLSGNQITQAEQEEQCTDPNCTECALEGGDTGSSGIGTINERLAWYPVRVPFNGTIIDRHITLGEFVSNAAEIFVVADLARVWLDLQIHQKDVALISKGQEVIVSDKSGVFETKGVIDRVYPVIDGSTRTTVARVVLDNAAGKFRPGMFVTANVLVEKLSAEVVVAKSSLQNVDDITCVFIQDDHGFELRSVELGLSNDEFVEVVSGLIPGETVVTKNSFRLKAELEKTAGGGHAGHGHAH